MRVRHSMLSQQLNHRVNNLQLEMTHLRGATYESLRLVSFFVIFRNTLHPVKLIFVVFGRLSYAFSRT